MARRASRRRPAPLPSTIVGQGGRLRESRVRALARAARSRPDASPWGHVVREGEDEGRRVLLVDGVVQSVLDDAAEAGYWGAMIPDTRPERALILGLGGGTIVRLLHARFGALPVVGVDVDGDVLEFARRELAALPDLPLEPVEADAFEYVEAAVDGGERFDFACVDLFRADAMPPEVTRRPFLRSLKRLLAPRGIAAFNVFADRRTDDRVRRIERVFRVLERRAIGKNVVVWCR